MFMPHYQRLYHIARRGGILFALHRACVSAGPAYAEIYHLCYNNHVFLFPACMYLLQSVSALRNSQV